MSEATLTLTDFLLARIAEDETAAKCATSGPWTYEARSPGQDGVVSAAEPHPESVGTNAFGVELSSNFVAMTSYDGLSGTVFNSDADGAHIARHNPARALRECEAKRAIVVAHPHSRDGQYHICADPHTFNGEDGFFDDGCPTLTALASVYADHPDFREEWKP